MNIKEETIFAEADLKPFSIVSIEVHAADQTTFALPMGKPIVHESDRWV